MVQPMHSPSLVGLVVERETNKRPDKNNFPSFKQSSSSTGFPSAQHRSKSAFARLREAKRNELSADAHGISKDEKITTVPVVQTSGSLRSVKSGENEEYDSLKVTDHNDKKGSSEITDISNNNSSEEKWKLQMQRDNNRVVEAMTEAERARHAEEIIEQLGPSIKELLQRVREARAKPQHVESIGENSEETPRETQDTSVSTEDDEKVSSSSVNSESHDESGALVELAQPSPKKLSIHKGRFSPPRGILTSPISRSSSPGRNAARKLRFADVTPNDIHVYQSEPSSPRRPLALLPPPLDSDKAHAIPLGFDSAKPRPLSTKFSASDIQPAEGTPEDIRRRFFPHLPPNDPSLEWIEGINEGDLQFDDVPRFDLAGTIIPKPQRSKLPTHLGLHHHAGSPVAGYTVDDLLLLGRSSVPAQRTTMLAVLAKIIRRVVLHEDSVSGLQDCNGLRNKALIVGLSALVEKGSLGVQAIDLVWACIVFWDDALVGDTEGVELKPSALNTDEEAGSEGLSTSDPISGIPFSSLLPKISTLLEATDLPSESLSQLLAIIHRFARHSVQIATLIVETPQLVSNIVRVFLLTPIPPLENGPLPNPSALTFLRTIALSCRENARTLVGPSDALLRFVTTAVPPTSSPFPRFIANSLLCGTLDLYSALARYGIYSGIATTAVEPFGRLAAYISGDNQQKSTTDEKIDEQVRISCLRLLSDWLVCARDPHRTIPTHDLLWSQVVGWTWSDDLLLLRKKLSDTPDENHASPRLWGHLWGALAAWMEGCRVNSPRAGEKERTDLNTIIEESWISGPEQRVLKLSIQSLQEVLNSNPISDGNSDLIISKLSDIGLVLSQYLRLCVACCSPSETDSGSPGVPKWVFDSFDLLLGFPRSLLVDPLLQRASQKYIRTEASLRSRIHYVHLRPVTAFLMSYARLWRRISLNKEDWLVFGFILLERLLPGDEEHALWLVGELIGTLELKMHWGNKLILLKPFLDYSICPNDTLYLSPTFPTPQSLQRITTQCTPANHFDDVQTSPFGLPLDRNWPYIALDHLLRSGTSPVLTDPKAVPDSWSASETDLVQGSLALLLYVSDAFSKIKDPAICAFSPKAEDVVFACMQVFMLEHNQQEVPNNEEVFRDVLVGQLMDKLLKPYTHGSFCLQQKDSLQQSKSKILGRGDIPTDTGLEVVSKKFLGKGTPFFQFYTDFIALYDAISFSHRTFARLLLPPTSMSYALDYRKLLWSDYGHILRTIRTPIEDVIVPSNSYGIKSYLYPVDTDPEMVGWYLRALIKWPALEGFIKFVAVHHVASNIWPDLQRGAWDGGNLSAEATNNHSNPIAVPSASLREKRSRVLLSAVLDQAGEESVKNVLCYKQKQIGLSSAPGILIPPSCFLTCSSSSDPNSDINLVKTRLDIVQRWGNASLLDKVTKVFASLSQGPK